jgi:hypothetical protein
MSSCHVTLRGDQLVSITPHRYFPEHNISLFLRAPLNGVGRERCSTPSLVAIAAYHHCKMICAVFLRELQSTSQRRVCKARDTGKGTTEEEAPGPASEFRPCSGPA